MQSHERFSFQGDDYLLSMLRYAKVVKTYWCRDKSSRDLVRDDYSRLFLYCREEEMNFNDVLDREDYLWVVVENEEDADELHLLSKLEILRPPYIAADETGWINSIEE